MAFKITIVETTAKPDVMKKWALLSEKTGDYGYVPAPEGAMRTVERKVLEQEVEALDLAAVIRAVNGL